jgi:hypothetical protein
MLIFVKVNECNKLEERESEEHPFNIYFLKAGDMGDIFLVFGMRFSYF